MTHKNIFLSKLTVAQLQARRLDLVGQLPGVEGVLRGSLQRQFRRCGKVGCHCAQGEPHGPYVYLAVNSEARRGMVYVPAKTLPEVERRVGLTGLIEDVLAEISAINVELLARGEMD